MLYYIDIIKYSAILLLLCLASCSSVTSLKKTDPSPYAAETSPITSLGKIIDGGFDQQTRGVKLSSFSPSETAANPRTTGPKGTLLGKRHPHVPELKFPVPSGTLSSSFGYRRGAFHSGLDITAPRGDDVLACADGEVICAGTRKGYRSYGRTVLVDHGHNVCTLYAHLSKICVRPGQKVRRGQTIAEVGNTGRATSPHLHVEVRVADRVYDPYVHFSRSELKGIEVAKGFTDSALGPVRLRRLSARR